MKLEGHSSIALPSEMCAPIDAKIVDQIRETIGHFLAETRMPGLSVAATGNAFQETFFDMVEDIAARFLP